MNSLVAKETGVLAESGLMEQSGKITAVNCFCVPSLSSCANFERKDATKVHNHSLSNAAHMQCQVLKSNQAKECDCNGMVGTLISSSSILYLVWNALP
jgi:hypothetical protein